MEYQGNPDAAAPQVWTDRGFQAPAPTRAVPPPIGPYTIGPGSHAGLPQILPVPSSSGGPYGTPGAHAGVSPSRPESRGPQAGPSTNPPSGANQTNNRLLLSRYGHGTPVHPYTMATQSRSHAGLSPSRPELGGPQAGPSTTASGSHRPPTQTVVSEAGPSTSQAAEISQSELAAFKLFAQMLQDRRINPADCLKRTAEQKPAIEKFKCQVEGCPYALTKYENLMGHYARVHMIPNPVRYHGFSMNRSTIDLSEDLAENQCVYCGHVARDAKDLEDHSATTHRALRHKKFNTVPYINTNEVAEASKSVFKCEVCSGAFPDKKELEEHHGKHHSNQVPCVICNKYVLFKDFVTHVKSSHGENEEPIVKIQRAKLGTRYFNCSNCTKWFFDENKAKRHHDDHVRGYGIHRKRTRRVENTDSYLVPSKEGNILFICKECNIATDSCDTLVEHSQDHIINPNIIFPKVTCGECNLTFQPQCYHNHKIKHYSDKHFSKESLTIYTYKYNLLFHDNWTAAINAPVEEIKRLFDNSIYTHTRSVKMLLIGTVNGKCKKVLNLYKCGQCSTFVEPASVANHTSNFNSCIKFTKKFACPICSRKFLSKLARDLHQSEHNDGEYIRIIAFNDIRDRKFNDILKKHSEISAENHSNINDDAVIYKCPCGLSFVCKEKSENHFKVCLKNDPIQNCPKCEALFNLSELEDHLKQHTIGGSKFVYKDISVISIEPIVIDSDDESKNDRATRDNSRENNNQMVVKVENSQTVNNSGSSSVPDNILLRDDEMAVQSKNVEVSTDEGTNNDDAAPLPGTATENEHVFKSESDKEVEGNSLGGDLNNEDRIQDTISNEEPLNANTHDVSNPNKIKCIVVTDLLLRPLIASVSQNRTVSDEGQYPKTLESVTVKQELLSKSNLTFDSHIKETHCDERIIDTIDLINDEDNSDRIAIDQTEICDINKDGDKDSETPLTLNDHTPKENCDEKPQSTNGTPSNTVTAYYNSFDSSENTAMEE